MLPWIIEAEQPGDELAIRAVHLAAFPTDAEARLVELLRDRGHATVSLVARIDAEIVGHVLFSPVTLERDGQVIAHGFGLAPLAVLPAHQKAGIGSALARAGLDACRALATSAPDRATAPSLCVVLGDPAYYTRFGFARASDRGIANEYAAHDEFMVLALDAALPAGGGLAKYGDEFRTL